MSDTTGELDRAGFEIVEAVDRTVWSLDWFAAQGGGAVRGPSVQVSVAHASDPPPFDLPVVMGQRFAAMGLNLVMNLIAGRVGIAQIVAVKGDR